MSPEYERLFRSRSTAPLFSGLHVASLGGKLRLFFLPPYSPELNPDEQVWNYVKHHGVAKATLRGGKGELGKLVLARLRSLQKLPWTIRMFFLTPDAQYAGI